MCVDPSFSDSFICFDLETKLFFGSVFFSGHLIKLLQNSRSVLVRVNFWLNSTLQNHASQVYVFTDYFTRIHLNILPCTSGFSSDVSVLQVGRVVRVVGVATPQWMSACWFCCGHLVKADSWMRQICVSCCGRPITNWTLRHMNTVTTSRWTWSAWDMSWHTTGTISTSKIRPSVWHLTTSNQRLVVLNSATMTTWFNLRRRMRSSETTISPTNCCQRGYNIHLCACSMSQTT